MSFFRGYSNVGRIENKTKGLLVVEGATEVHLEAAIQVAASRTGPTTVVLAGTKLRAVRSLARSLNHSFISQICRSL